MSPTEGQAFFSFRPLRHVDMGRENHLPKLSSDLYACTMACADPHDVVIKAKSRVRRKEGTRSLETQKVTPSPRWHWVEQLPVSEEHSESECEGSREPMWSTSASPDPWSLLSLPPFRLQSLSCLPRRCHPLPRFEAKHLRPGALVLTLRSQS